MSGGGANGVDLDVRAVPRAQRDVEAQAAVRAEAVAVGRAVVPVTGAAGLTVVPEVAGLEPPPPRGVRAVVAVGDAETQTGADHDVYSPIGLRRGCSRMLTRSVSRRISSGISISKASKLPTWVQELTNAYLRENRDT